MEEEFGWGREALADHSRDTGLSALQGAAVSIMCRKIDDMMKI